MERRRVLAAGTLLLGLLAIAATAGIYGGRSGPGFGGGPTGDGGTAGAPTQVGLPAWLVENAIAILLVGSVVCFAVGLLVIVWLRGREGLEAVARFLGRNLLVGVLVLLFFAGVRMLLEYVGTRPTQPPGAGPGGPGGGGGGGTGAGGAGGAGGSIPPIVIVLVVLALFGLFAYVAFQRRQTAAVTGGGGSRETPPQPNAEFGADETAIAIEDVPQTNAVYRAWREMATRAVDARDRTVTASEVARAAVGAGFDREAVDRLTGLFQEVRYGNRPVTEERERRAEDALRALDDAGEGGA